MMRRLKRQLRHWGGPCPRESPVICQLQLVTDYDVFCMQMVIAQQWPLRRCLRRLAAVARMRRSVALRAFRTSSTSYQSHSSFSLMGEECATYLYE